jgi:catechol 2,3-dioxygenase-like lactoylglutathione lyase family enzyme
MGDLSLDHVGIMMRDLDAGVERWHKLGFKLSRRSAQMGMVPGKSGMAPWATSNHCAMFERGYLELIGITNPENFNPWTAFLDRFEGPHITALRCEEADRTYAALSVRIDHFDPPLQRLRNAPYGDGERPFKFRNIFSQDAHFPEGRFIIIEHQSPEVIWQENLMMQPNGAKSLAGLIFCADTQSGTLDRLVRISGEHPSELEGRKLLKLGGGGWLSVIDAVGFAVRYPGAPEPSQPAVAASVIEVESLAYLAAILGKNGVLFHWSDRTSLWVGPEEANGAVIEFIETVG